jgi:hypothetical protein
MVFIGLFEKGCVNILEDIQALDSRSANGLCAGVHVRGFSKKLYISILRKLRVIANNIKECLHGGLVGCARSRSEAARLIYEIQIGIYGLFHGYMSFHLMPIISNKNGIVK